MMTVNENIFQKKQNPTSLNFISLFSGIGGFEIGLERAGMRCIGQVENDPYCLKVLEKHWPNVKRVEDIHDVTGTTFGAAELICGGPPCQPTSCAGKRRGSEDDRWLWPEALRVVREVRPAWCLFENPTGILTLNKGLEFKGVLSALEVEGYEIESFIIPAVSVDANHRRDRVWIVAHSESNGFEWDRPSWEQKSNTRCGKEKSKRGCNALPNPQGEQMGAAGQPWENASRYSEWPAEPGLGRVANGIPNRAHRLRALGNAVVPQVVEEIGKAIMYAHKQKE